MENNKYGLMAKSGQPANDMARSTIFPQINSITADKTDIKSSVQKDRSFEDVKETPRKRVTFSSFAKAPLPVPEELTQNRGIFVPAGTTFEELQAHFKAKGVEPSAHLVSVVKEMEEKEKSKKLEQNAKLNKKLVEDRAKLVKMLEEQVDRLPIGSSRYGGYGTRRLTPKDEKELGYGSTYGKSFAPAGEKMYAPPNHRGKFINPYDKKTLGQADSKEQLLDGEYQSVTKEEAEDEWMLV